MIASKDFAAKAVEFGYAGQVYEAGKGKAQEIRFIKFRTDIFIFFLFCVQV